MNTRTVCTVRTRVLRITHVRNMKRVLGKIETRFYSDPLQSYRMSGISSRDIKGDHRSSERGYVPTRTAYCMHTGRECHKLEDGGLFAAALDRAEYTVQGSQQYMTMAAEDKREVECLANNKNPEGAGGTESKSAAYSRNLKAFRNNQRGTSKADLLERSHSAAYLMGSRKSKEAILGIKKNALSGGVKLEVRMPYGFHHNNDDNLDDTESLTDFTNSEHEGEDAPEKSVTTLPTSLGLPTQKSSSKRENKMSLDELLESNHSKLQHRRRRRRQHHKLENSAHGRRGRMELRKTLSSGKIHAMSQAMSPTDIFNLKESLHGVQRNRQGITRDVASDGVGGEEEEIPVESQATSCYEYTVVDEDDYKQVGEEDESSYEVFSYDSSSCTSSFLKSDNGSAAAGVDPVDYFNDADDASQGSGFSIEMKTEHCHSSITAEDWESLFEESFAVESVFADASVDYYEESVSTFFEEKGVDKSDHVDHVLGFLESKVTLLEEEEEVVEDSIDEVAEDSNHKQPNLGCGESESALLAEEVMVDSSHNDPAPGYEKSETTLLVEEVVKDSSGKTREHSDEEVSEYLDRRDSLREYKETNSIPIDEKVIDGGFLSDHVLGHEESPIDKEEVIGEAELHTPVLGHGGPGPVPTAKEEPKLVIDDKNEDEYLAVNESSEVIEDVEEEKVGPVASARKYRVSNERFCIPKPTSGWGVTDRIAQQRVKQEIHGAIAATSSPPSLSASTHKGNAGHSNGTKRKSRRVAALIAMFEKNCQS